MWSLPRSGFPVYVNYKCFSGEWRRIWTHLGSGYRYTLRINAPPESGGGYGRTVAQVAVILQG